MEGIEFGAEILKADDEKRIVYGWASVYEMNGESVVDKQGDMLDEDEVMKMAHAFMREVRVGKAMHRGHPVGEIVESLVLTTDVQKSLGIDLGKAGWYIGMKINDEAVWDRIKKQELQAFSIGGSGKRKAMEAA